ncbi:MAG TPA: extracellular solute-binding protein [Candidatus Acidoferrales bacterium]|jgi:ABC-type Fe3+ transport system substrate-binding protein|nr:extracellular solute-binding protein [Candidatus Acidoferrales bacterium]
MLRVRKPRSRSSLAVRFTLIVLVASTLLIAYISAGQQDLDTLFSKAKSEGTLILYTGGPTAPWEATAKEFSARYPGISVSVTGGFSNVLDKKIDAQLASGKLEVDLAIFQTLQDFVRWKEQGALLEFKPQGFANINPSFKDPNGAYVAIQINAHAYAYNPDLVKPEDVPRSALDFLNPRFKGKVVSCYPADDDATLYDFYSIVEKYGWSYMDRYMANQPNFIQGHLGVVRSIASGENLVTFDTIASISMDQKNLGLAQAVAFPESDPLPIWPFTAAIFKSAAHPNAAELFLTWYLSPEVQTKTGNWSPRTDVPAPYGWKPILSYKVINDYRSFLTNTKQLEELRKRFEAYTGPVKNVGGVR